MIVAEAHLKSASPFSYNKHYQVDKLERELDNAYEERTWRERCHVNNDGYLIIPPMMFANSIKAAAQYMAIPVPGKRGALFTKNFQAGVMVVNELVLPIKKDEIESEWVFVPSDGKRGGGSRVSKCFPIIREWEGTVSYYILDPIITQDIFEQVLAASGSLIGIGRFRPRNLGYYGRFTIKSVKWTEQK